MWRIDKRELASGVLSMNRFVVVRDDGTVAQTPVVAKTKARRFKNIESAQRYADILNAGAHVCPKCAHTEPRKYNPTLERAVEWASQRGYATGPADTIEELLNELERQMTECANSQTA